MQLIKFRIKKITVGTWESEQVWLVKLGKRTVGKIVKKLGKEEIYLYKRERIRLHTSDSNFKKVYRWIKIDRRFNTINETQIWLNNHRDEIRRTYRNSEINRELNRKDYV